MNLQLWWFYFRSCLTGNRVEKNQLSLFKLRRIDPSSSEEIDAILERYFVVSGIVLTEDIIRKLLEIRKERKLPFHITVYADEIPALSALWELTRYINWIGEIFPREIEQKYLNKVQRIKYEGNQDLSKLQFPNLKVFVQTWNNITNIPQTPSLRELKAQNSELIRKFARQNIASWNSVIYDSLNLPPDFWKVLPTNLRRLEILLKEEETEIDLAQFKYLEEIELTNVLSSARKISVRTPNSLRILRINLSNNVELDFSTNFEGKLKVFAYSGNFLLNFNSSRALKKVVFERSALSRLRFPYDESQIRFNKKAISARTCIKFKRKPVLTGIVRENSVSLQPLENVRVFEEVPSDFFLSLLQKYSLPDLHRLSIRLIKVVDLQFQKRIIDDFEELQIWLNEEEENYRTQTFDNVLQLQIRDSSDGKFDYVLLWKIFRALPNIEDLEFATVQPQEARLALESLEIEKLCAQLKRIRINEILPSKIF